MKRLNRQIDRFCYRHPNFGIPNLIIYLLIANGIAFVISLMDTTYLFQSFLVFDTQAILRGQIWRLVTFLMIPYSPSILYEALAVYLYYFIGTSIERIWGTARFNLFYFGSALLSAIYAFLMGLLGFPESGLMLSPHYINVSMFLVFSLFYPEMEFRIFFLIPVKGKYLSLLELVFCIYEILTLPGTAKALPVFALLAVAVFCWDSIVSILRRRPSKQVRNNVIRFRNETRAAEREESTKPYHHRCEICGRTDTDHPELEFRYCSRCEGYHCFCQDHINNHQHFTS